MNEEQKEKLKTSIEHLNIILDDHPRFNAEINKIKEKNNIPQNGFEIEEYLKWKFTNPEKYKDYFKSVEKLGREMKLSNFMRRLISRIIEIKVLFVDKEHELEKMLQDNLSPFLIIENKTINDELKRSDKYDFFVKINPWATKSDMNDLWKQITSMRNESVVETDRDRFFIPKINEQNRQAWLLRNQGYNNEEIAKKLKSFNNTFTKYDMPGLQRRYEKETLGKILDLE